MNNENVYCEYLTPPSDSSRLINILKKLDDALMPGLSKRVNIKEYADKLAINADLLYLCCNGNDIGNCAIYTNKHDMAYISSYGICEKYQHKGYGTILWLNVKHILLLKKIKNISFKIYFDNIKAINFFKKKGFKITGVENKWFIMQTEIF